MLLIQSFVNVARAALRCQVAAIAAVTMAGAALLGAQSAALAQAPATSEPVAFPINRPTLQVGDSWQYQRTDLWKNEVNLNKASFKLTSMTKEGNYRFDLTNFQGVASKFSSDLDLNGVKYKVQGEDMVQTWNKWPVTDGMSWEFAYKRLFDNGTIATYTVNCKINGLEKVVGPAGTFDVVKRVCKAFWTNSLGGTGSGEVISLYAPAVKRMVREQNRWWVGSALQEQTLDELVSFKVQ